MTMRRAGKVDGTQREIVAALVKVGASVQTLANCGGGVPDLLVGFGGANYLLEAKTSESVKRPDSGLTKAQIEWLSKWRGQVRVVTTSKGALDAIGFFKDAREAADG